MSKNSIVRIYSDSQVTYEEMRERFSRKYPDVQGCRIVRVYNPETQLRGIRAAEIWLDELASNKHIEIFADPIARGTKITFKQVP